jgi:hypothetical protein
LLRNAPQDEVGEGAPPQDEDGVLARSLLIG